MRFRPRLIHRKLIVDDAESPGDKPKQIAETHLGAEDSPSPHVHELLARGSTARGNNDQLPHPQTPNGSTTTEVLEQKEPFIFIRPTGISRIRSTASRYS